METAEVCGIARVIERMAAITENIAAETTERIRHFARTPVLGRRERDINAANAGRLPPGEGRNFAKAKICNQIVDIPGHEGSRSLACKPARVANDPAQRRQVKVIHVRM